MKRRGFLSALGVGALAAPIATVVKTMPADAPRIEQIMELQALQVSAMTDAGTIASQFATTGYLRAEGIMGNDVLKGREECLYYYDGNGEPL